MGKNLGSLFVFLGLNTSEFDKKMAEVDKNLRKFGGNLEQAGIRLSAVVGAPLAAIGVKSLQAYKSFDSAFTGVKKTVDGSVQDFKNLEKGILDMSKRLPASAVEIAKVAEVAGQMGIKTKDLLGFTETMVMLGETTNLSAETAAETLGKFATVTRTSTEDFGRLGATLVDLGNNFNGTEANIAAMAQKLASTGTQIGLSQAEILGFANSLVSVGMEADAGGSAFSRVFKEIQVAVEMGGESLKDFAGIAGGLSSKEFKELFNKDAGEAITRFIEGFGRIKEVGGSAIQVLDKLGLSEIRVSDATLSTANAQGLVRKSVEAANLAWQKQDALVKEMAVRNGSLAAQMDMVKNSLTAVGIEIGRMLAPQVIGISSLIKNLASAFDLIPGPIKQFIVYFGEALVLITGAITVIGVLSKAIGLLGIASMAPVAGFAAFAAGLGVVLSYVYEATSNGGLAVLSDWFSLKLREAINSGIKAFYDFINAIGRGLTNLRNDYLVPFFNSFGSFFGKDLKLSTEPFKEFKAELIDTERAQARLSGSVLAYKKLTSDAAEESAKKQEEAQKAIEKFLPKIPNLAGDASKAAAKEAKKAKEEIQKLNDQLTQKISQNNLDFLKQNYEGALKAGATKTADSIKNALKEATTQGILDGVQDVNRNNPEVIETANKIAQIEVDKMTSDISESVKNAGQAAQDSLMKELPDFLAKGITDAIMGGIEGGLNADTIKNLGSSVASVFANQFQSSFKDLFKFDANGNFAGFDFANLGSSFANLGIAYGLSSLTSNLSDNKKDPAGGVVSGAVLGASVGSIIPGVGTLVGAGVGALVGGTAGYFVGSMGKSSDRATNARKDTINFIEDKIKGSYLPFLTENGNIILGDSNRFNIKQDGGFFSDAIRAAGNAYAYYASGGLSALNGDTREAGGNMAAGGPRYDAVPGQIQGTGWADQYWAQFGQEGGAQFQALGTAMTKFAGQTAEEAEKIGVVLAENLNGNLDNARMLLQTMGISAADLEEALLQVGLTGEKSWHEIEVSMQQIPALTGEGLSGIGDVIGAYEQLINSAGRGQTTLFALRNLAIETAEKGGSSLQDLKAQLMAAGVSTEDADRLLQALGQRGIRSLEELKNASDRTLGGVAADLESLGISWGENINQQVEDSVQSLDKLDKKLKNLSKEVDLKINVSYANQNNPDSVVANAMGNVFNESGIKKFAKGDVFNSTRTFSFGKNNIGVLGEAGPEGVFPLKRMKNGELGIIAEMKGSQGTVIYNVDARGGTPGIEKTIIAAMKMTHEKAVSDSISAMYDLKRRGR